MGKERKRNNDYIGTILRHVATSWMVMEDGQRNEFASSEEHRKGVEVVRILVEETAKIGILSYFMLSLKTEKPVNEIQGLMRLFVKHGQIWQGVEDNKVRVKFWKETDSRGLQFCR